MNIRSFLLFILILNFSNENLDYMEFVKDSIKSQPITNDHPKRITQKKEPFVSKAVNDHIEEITKQIKDNKIREVFQKCYKNTLDTTVDYDEKNNDTFIITGDIAAMWLRDSSFQVYPYIKHCFKDEHLNKMIIGLINRDLKSIKIDPYANAFNKNEAYSPWQSDRTTKRVNGHTEQAMNKKIWERKFELDSLICPLFLINEYFENTKNFGIFNQEFFEVMEIILTVVKNEKLGTDDEDKNGGPQYTFVRSGNVPFDTQHQGRGNPTLTCGLVKCNFRNSDDTTLFAYNIPENAFLVATFRNLVKNMNENIEDILKNFEGNKNYSSDKVKSIISKMEEEYKSIDEAIKNNGIMYDEETNEKYYAYEVDGFGNQVFMEDPGYPSLMSLPFLRYCDSNDPIYLNTRKRILSLRNPYYIEGRSGYGVASTHSYRRYIWHLFTLMQGITSNDKKEIKYILDLLMKTASGGFMHESFNVDSPNAYTRSWFAWANSFFGVFIESIFEKYPEILSEKPIRRKGDDYIN